MNDQTAPLATAIPPEVRLFLAVVRRELADLDPEELSEITDGLEADLADLVAERGPEALGEPKAYARELRAAAGITETATRTSRRPARDALTAYLDACRDWALRQVERVPGDTRPAMQWLRPAWWIARAWLATVLVCAVFGIAVLGLPGLLVLAVAVAGSIQLGRGKFWPGGDRGLLARVVLLGLNAFAVAVSPFMLAEASGPDYAGADWEMAWNDGHQAGLAEAVDGVEDPQGRSGILVNGKRVTNIYPYDSQGRRMAGVQLFDQDGKPLDAPADAVCPRSDDGAEIGREEDSEGGWLCYDYHQGSSVPGMVFYPWTNGQAQLTNVFPLAGRMQEDLEPSPTAFQEADKPTLGLWPFAEVPRVSLPGITSGVLDDEPGKPAPATTD